MPGQSTAGGPSFQANAHRRFQIEFMMAIFTRVCARASMRTHRTQDPFEARIVRQLRPKRIQPDERRQKI
jgi:hypothetical protein